MAKEKLSGWANYPQKICRIEIPETLENLDTKNKRLIIRGMGRSYGDSSFLGEKTILFENLRKIISYDKKKGIIETQGGLSVSDLLKEIIPDGWFLPVSPGTKFVTIGGMVASDVHGKNHHLDGSFGNHIISLKIQTGENKIIECSNNKNSNLFWSTIGGMGLTGAIISVVFKLKSIKTYEINQKIIPANNLKEIMNLFEKFKDSTYTVAWIDCLSKGKNIGRSILIVGEHSKRDISKKKYNPKPIFNLSFFPPSLIMNVFFMRIFNFFYFYKNKFSYKKFIDGDSYFYPLDKILNWNKFYGKKGFIQYQFVIPSENSYAALSLILEKISSSKNGSFLSVLKKFKEGNSGLLSFPIEGYTLALDFPIKKNTFNLLEELDEVVIRFKGRVYLAKDSRLSPNNFEKMYNNINEFNEIRKLYNSNNFISEQFFRLQNK